MVKDCEKMKQTFPLNIISLGNDVMNVTINWAPLTEPHVTAFKIYYIENKSQGLGMMPLPPR